MEEEEKKKKKKGSTKRRQQQHTENRNKNKKRKLSLLETDSGSYRSTEEEGEGSVEDGNYVYTRGTLRYLVRTALLDFMRLSPFENLAGSIGSVKYHGFEDGLVDDIIHMSSPYYGVNYAIETVNQALCDAAMEASIRFTELYKGGDHFKKPRALYVTYKKLPFPEIRLDEVRNAPEEILFAYKKELRDIAYFDRINNFEEAYLSNGNKIANILSVRLGKGRESFYSQLMPCKAKIFDIH